MSDFLMRKSDIFFMVSNGKKISYQIVAFFSEGLATPTVGFVSENRYRIFVVGCNQVDGEAIDNYMFYVFFPFFYKKAMCSMCSKLFFFRA